MLTYGGNDDIDWLIGGQMLTVKRCDNGQWTCYAVDLPYAKHTHTLAAFSNLTSGNQDLFISYTRGMTENANVRVLQRRESFQQEPAE